MATPLQEFDVVKLLKDCGKHKTGEEGTVIELLDSKTYLVEFTDGDDLDLEVFDNRWGDWLELVWRPETGD